MGATLREKEAEAARQQKQSEQIRADTESAQQEHERLMSELDDRSKAQKELFEQQLEDFLERNHRKGCKPIVYKRQSSRLKAISRSMSGSVGVGDVAGVERAPNGKLV